MLCTVLQKILTELVIERRLLRYFVSSKAKNLKFFRLIAKLEITGLGSIVRNIPFKNRMKDVPKN